MSKQSSGIRVASVLVENVAFEESDIDVVGEAPEEPCSLTVNHIVQFLGKTYFCGVMLLNLGYGIRLNLFQLRSTCQTLNALVRN